MHKDDPIKLISRFPSKHKILSENFAQFNNFFPIATIDLVPFGINDKLHIVFTFLDPENKELKFLNPDDNVDVFGFEILPNGMYLPTFEQSSLKITANAN